MHLGCQDMNYFYISGWNTPATLLADFLAPIVTDQVGSKWQELSYLAFQDIDRLYHNWQQQIGEQPCVIVAWSLGGNLAIDYLQRHSHNCKGLICMATNLNFVDAIYGMPEVRFKQFYHGFEQQPTVQQKRFMQLISKGASKAVIRLCRQHYAQYQPNQQLLVQLLWLQTIKLSTENLPSCLLECWFANEDVLVPNLAAVLFKNSRKFSGSHVFFIEQADYFQQQIQTLLLEVKHG